MNIVRFQGRPKQGGATVGKDKIILDSLTLLRSGQQFSSKKDLALAIGVTPALLNYYFFKGDDFLVEPIKVLLQTYAERLSSIWERREAENNAWVDEVLRTIIEMHIVEGHLIKRHASSQVGRPLLDCPITFMKGVLASAIVTQISSGSDQSLLASTVADMVWGACATSTIHSSVALRVRLAKHLISLPCAMSRIDCTPKWKSLPLASLLAFGSQAAGYTIDLLTAIITHNTGPLVSIF